MTENLSEDEGIENTENDEDEILNEEKTMKEIESNEMKDLKNELKRVMTPMIAPSMFPPPAVKCQNPDDYPDSYRYNSKKEELVLEYVENFKKQFQYIYPDRRYLLLTPLNECGTEKFVCSTIKPTTLLFSEVYDWHKCALFVAEYLQFEALDNPTEYPPVLWSPTKVLKDQKGNCFNYSVLLASLLIGAGYDAYVVCGYATREICNMDESRNICPLHVKIESSKTSSKHKDLGKYSVKPPRDLTSKYLIAQDERVQKTLRDQQEKRKKEQENAILELEKPPPDRLHGLRIHCWVLVLSGKREVPESFFIESLTGTAKSTQDHSYLGIECLWNHMNYWVNMQKCIDGTAGLVFDLGDSSKWEYMLPSNEKPLLLLPSETNDAEDNVDEDEEEDDKKNLEKNLDLPPSWVSHIQITPRDFEKRCPEGKKVILYKKCKVEKFAPYLLKDNLVMKISEYNDYELTDVKKVTEHFIQRSDKLEERQVDFTTGWVHEKFGSGRGRFLKEHKYQQNKTAPENERIMHFYSNARLDGLKSREETPTEMTELYEKRIDYLFYRKVFYGKRQKKFGPQEGDNYRPILKIIDRYNRNVEKPANDDIYEIIFNIDGDKFQVTYHRESSKIAPSTREFIKPQNWADKGSTWTWNNDLHQTYQSGTEFKAKKNVELYQNLVKFLEKEDLVKTAVRKSEEEVKTIINERTHEEAISELTISIYDTTRNVKAEKYKHDLEKKIAEEKLRRQTFEADYLAPFLAEKGITDINDISQSIAIELKERCLADLKQRLIDKANLIQKRFENENSELQKKQHWYQANQINMSKDDEQEYVEYCAEAMFRIHMLELRLNRHKEMAPLKYSELEQKLRADPRLSEHLSI